MHSKISDGQDEPEELVQIAAAAGISVMSLTDHDTIGGIAMARAAALSLGIGFIPGIEISARDNRELHILGYGVDDRDAGLISFYNENRCHRIARRDRLIELFNRNGIPVTLQKIEEVNEGKSSGRPHIARTLVAMGYAESVNDAFDRYLKTPEYYCLERPKPWADEGINMIKRAGGVAVLAHPYSLKLPDKPFRELLSQLIRSGLKGIECYYSRHTSEEVEYYRTIADEYGLFCTIGSDYHGPWMKPEIQPGTGKNGSLLFAEAYEQETLSRLRSAIDDARRNI